MRYIHIANILTHDFIDENCDTEHLGVGTDHKDTIWFPPKLLREGVQTDYEIYVEEEPSHFNFFSIINYLKEFNPYENTSTPIVAYPYMDNNGVRKLQHYKIKIIIVDNEIESNIRIDDGPDATLFTAIPVLITVRKYGKDIIYDR